MHPYNPESDVRLHAGHLEGQKYDLLGIIGTMLMKDPVFPVPSALIEKACSFNDYQCGKVFDLGDGIVIKTRKLNHPNGACGYRIEYGGKVLSICTDTEHYEGKLDEEVLALADNADAIVYDAAYTSEEYPKFKGWGHSTWRKQSRLLMPQMSKIHFYSTMILRIAIKKWMKLRKKRIPLILRSDQQLKVKN